MPRLASIVLAIAFLAGPSVAIGEERRALRAQGAVAFGSVEDTGYGATAIFNGGYEFDDVFSIEVQGGIGITDEIGIGPSQFFHGELLLPAKMTLCSSDSWACPGSTFELEVLSGVGGARFEGRWAPHVVAGVALDSFRPVGPLEVGVRAAIFGYFDPMHADQLITMMQIHLGVILRVGI
ncbi:MAG: hypothetical protein PHU25_06505 [Deltaproteobacteria bacterium]|nr:hypothetical protein [Deltaproteobacteria bacterium]